MRTVVTGNTIRYNTRTPFFSIQAA
ncbi:hypothetical protein DP180_10350 [Enterobacter kobei]|uniref:Uncharacterized protein n=1 Tax=Enterobacter kobei TaxID=208224 RepID=A0ABX9F3Q3_9ENTR|nr:hypothetical protein D9T11_22205 [Enterobacter kobei]PYZ35592.1 hypothetical protein DNK77_25260 [Enterobacter cloacae complex sp.]QCE25638.1 hypothetical protein FAI36_08495 [Enterobacter bugandensis]RGD14411.1 hypothetical protein DW197_05305 [Enterobacter sp. AM17-18]RJL03280.1 hypothetical protein D5066_06300 [Enterobacter chuandaensis]